MRIADTSCLYAAVIAEDAHHAEARARLAAPEPIIVPGEIFAETIALLQHRKSFDVALSAGSGFRALPHLRIESTPSAIASRAWQEYESAAGKLSLPDAFVVAWSAHEGATPLTFDKEIVRRAARS